MFFGGDVFGVVAAVGAVVVVGVRVFRQTLRRVARCRCSFSVSVAGVPLFGVRSVVVFYCLPLWSYFIRQNIKSRCNPSTVKNVKSLVFY